MPNIPTRTGRAMRGAADRLLRILLAGAALCAVGLSPGAANAAESAMAVDAGTGQVLYAYRPDALAHPASLTKIMTVFMAFDALADGRLRPDQPLTVSRHAAAQPPSRLRLRRGQTISVRDAILALITKSANDAAVVLAEGIAGTEPAFAAAMTRKARSLGMGDTVFRNASGLHDPAQVTTARDMARLAMALLREHPKRYGEFSTQVFKWRGRRYRNHNPLLDGYRGADGIKTGYIRQSGYNLVGSAVRDDRRVVAVVLGGRSTARRDWAMTTLLDHAFDRLGGDAPTAPELPYIADATGERAVKLAVASGAGAIPRATTADVAAAPRVPPSRPRPADAEDGGWSVQVGAYTSAPPAEEAALLAREKAKGILGHSKPAVLPVTRGGARMYRARLTGLSETEARSACRKLSLHSIPCLAVSETGEFRTSSLVQ